MVYSALTYTIAFTALTALLLIPLAVFWLLTAVSVHTKQDPARKGFRWLKAVFPFELLALILSCASAALNIAIAYAYDTDTLAEAVYMLSTVGTFCDQIASILAIVAIFEIGLGILLVCAGAIDRKTAAARHTIKRIFIAIACGILTILSIVVFALSLHAYSSYFKVVRDTGYTRSNYRSRVSQAYDTFQRRINNAALINGVTEIGFTIVAVPLLVLGVVVLNRGRKLETLRNSSTCFFVATLFWAIRYLWHIVYAGMYTLTSASYVDPGVVIVDPILSSYTFLVVLILLYIVGRRRINGVWTTSQPWMAGYAATAYGTGNYESQGYNPFPAAGQYQQYPSQDKYTVA